jgi:alcohol dehydrogenase class IV
MKFNYHAPANLIFGAGALDGIGPLAAGLGRKALLVTGRSSAKKSGLTDRVLGLLSKAGVAADVFAEVAPNPTTTSVAAGAEAARRLGSDLVIGLGGGSSLDAAKGIAFAINNRGRMMDYVFGRIQQEGPVPPIMLVPTTCGTGSEGNSFAVMNEPETGDKKSLRKPSIFAAISVIDPDLMRTLPPRVLAEVGFDAVCHLTEAYLARNAQPMTDVMALDGLARSHRSLKAVLAGGGSDAQWEDLAWASTLGGMSIGPGCIVAPHGMEHPLSGLKGDVSHAIGLAAISLNIYRRTLPAASDRFAVLAGLMGGASADDFLPLFEKLVSDLGLATRLGCLGFTEADVPWLAENAIKVSAPGINNHPVVFTAEQIADIYRSCL